MYHQVKSSCLALGIEIRFRQADSVALAFYLANLKCIMKPSNKLLSKFPMCSSMPVGTISYVETPAMCFS
jgi:hypothetical protein